MFNRPIQQSGKSSLAKALLLFLVFVSQTHLIFAVTKTAVQTGDWNSTSTWGGSTPAPTDNVNIPSGITVDFSNSWSITNVTINGALQSPNASTLTVLGTWSGSGSFAGGPSSTVLFNPNAGSITFPTTGTWNFRNLSINAGKIFNGSSGANIVVNGGYFINNGTFNHNNGTITIHNNGGVSGSSVTTFFNLNAVYNLTAPSGNMIIEGDLTLGGSYINSNGTITFNGNTNIGPVNGYTHSFNNVVINAGKTLTARAGTMNIKGTFTNNGTFNHNNGTVIFNGNTTLGGSSATNFANIQILSACTLNLGTINISIAGNFTNDGTFVHNNRNVTFNGSTNQFYSGASPISFYDLQINTVGLYTVDLTNPSNVVDVSNILTLSNGMLTAGSYEINVVSSSPSAVSGNFSNSWVNGILRRGVNIGAYDYPIGNAANPELFSLNITSISSGSDVAVSYVSPMSGIAPSLTLHCEPVNSTLDNGYWSVVPNGGIGSVTFDATLTERGHTNSAADPHSYTVLRRDNSASAWVLEGFHDNITQTESGGSATAKRFNLSNFGEFAIGKSDNAFLNSGSIGSPQTICYNATPSALTEITAPTGGTGSYTYQWQYSNDNTTFFDLTGETNPGYSPPNLTTSTYYRRQVTSGACGTVNSPSILITVYANLYAGSVGSAQNICYNTSPSLFTQLIAPSGGTGTYTYQWISSPDNISWAAISGATSSTYTSGVLIADKYFRRVVYSGSCGSDTSASFLISIFSELSSAGTVGSEQTICSGLVPSFFNELSAAGGGNGSYTYQWQNSSDNSFWANIAGATSNTYSSPAMTATKYFRRRVTSGNCPSLFTPSFLVTVNPLPQGSFTGNAFCNPGTGLLTWTASAGTGPFSINYNGGTSELQNGVVSGVAFNSNPNPGTTTVFNLTSVTDANGCVRSSGFTGGSATITVNNGLPSAPVATAGSGITSTSFSANWNAVTGANGYYLDVSTSNTFSTFISGYNNLSVGNVTTKSVTGLSGSTTYYYRVRASNGCGINPSGSNTISCTTLSNPVNSYCFSTASSGFSLIGGGTTVASGSAVDDNVYSNQAIGFTFNFMGTNYSTLNVSSNGFVTFGSAPSTTNYTPISTNTAGYSVISAFGMDLVGTASGTIKTLTMGNSPVRIFVIEYASWARYIGGAQADNINFQIKLHESFNKVEIVYGNCSATASSASVQVGLRGSSNADFNNRKGSWSISTPGTLNSDNIISASSSLPINGSTFSYSPWPGTPGDITGTVLICAGQSGVAYSVTSAMNTLNYTWSLPSGCSLASGSGTTAVTVDYSAGAISGNVSVAGTNQCGSGPTVSFPVTVSPMPTTANAGSDQNLCNVTTTTLAGNNPSSGTGSWSLISGSATITTPTSPTSPVTGLTPGSSATLRWTISNSPCTPSTDDVMISVFTGPTIITSQISPSSYCAGGSISISYDIACSFNTGNVFTAQLSDASGSFSSPTVLGTINSVNAGTFNAEIPSATPAGSGYRIRVVSSDPVITGSDNGADLAISVCTRYWVDNAGNWNDPSHWSATSGGVAGASIPHKGVYVYLDNSSFSGPGQIITVPAGNWYMKNISMTGYGQQVIIVGLGSMMVGQ